MKIYTAKYKAEQPANKELHVPTNSKYGVGLQFEKDGQPWDLLPDEVTLDGLSADDVVDGTFIFERTSGEYGQKVSDVRAADMGVHVSADNVVSTYNSKARIVQNYQAKFVDLSSILDEPVEVTYDQLKIWTRSGRSEEAMLSSDFFFWNDDINSMNYVSHTIFPCYAGGLSPFTYVYMWPYTRQFFCYPVGGGQAVMLDKLTLYPDGSIYVRTSIAAKSYFWLEGKATIDTADTVRNYKLTETTEDQGVVLGFNEKYVLKDTITLSGTNDDDTTFSYTLPTTN